MEQKHNQLCVLSIGAGDCGSRLEELGLRAGISIHTAHLDREYPSLRDLARALAESGVAQGGENGADEPLHQLLTQQKWDVILLQQHPAFAGLGATYNGDLDCLLDYFADVCPGAKVFWTMPWAFSPQTKVFPGYFKLYYDNSQALMYNAILRSAQEHILNGEFAGRIGWCPVGAVVQEMRRLWNEELTTDGWHLTQEGQLVAGMTVLHTLFPEVELEPLTDGKPELAAAVRRNCTEVPELLKTEPAVTIEQAGKPGDHTVLQAVAPLKLYFPDIIRLKDGRMLLCVYEHNCHVPHNGVKTDLYAQQGAGRILVLEGDGSGLNWDYEHPLLVIDEIYMANWGAVQTRGRYEKLKRGEKDYWIISDPRDPNIGLVHTDLTGDGQLDEVVMLTFWMCNYGVEGSGHEVYMVHSLDGGRSWSVPWELKREDGLCALKRGDIASFANGEILIPYYSLRRESSRVGALRMHWDPDKGEWVRSADYEIPNTAPWEGNSYNFNEVSLVAPDPQTDEVYAFIRESGAVLCSTDRGEHWQEVGVEPGLIHQPGFAMLDEQRVFTSWARSVLPRTIYGKVFYVNAGWDYTLTQEVYASPDTSVHDMADPSCKQLEDGRVIVVCYDTTYRSIIGNIIDPNEERCLPVELQERIPAGELFAADLANAAAQGEVFFEHLPGSCTLELEACFGEEGTLSLELGRAGRITLCAGAHGIEQDVPCALRIAAVGTLMWIRGADGWTPVETAAAGQDGLCLWAQGVRLGAVRLTRRIHIEMHERMDTFQNGPEVQLEPRVNPVDAALCWSSSDPAVVSVDENGEMRVNGVGEATVSVTADSVTAACAVTVHPEPAEAAAGGARDALFRDDFEDYEEGENAFWTQMTEHGYMPGADNAPNRYRGYDIRSVDGNKQLWLRSGVSWMNIFALQQPMTGEYTLQFDFLFTHPRTSHSSIRTSPGQIFTIDLWQGSDVWGKVQLTPEGVRLEHKPQGADQPRMWPDKFEWMVKYPLNCWHTAKLVRVQGGICVKIWRKGEDEPERWDYVLFSPELDAGQPGCVGLKYYVAETVCQQLALDNFTVTRREM